MRRCIWSRRTVWSGSWKPWTRQIRCFFVGVGRVMLALEAIAKRWAHLGVKTHLVGEITEPAITPNDLLIVGSGSGTTLFPAGIAQKAHQIGAKIVHIGSNPNSPLREISEFKQLDMKSLWQYHANLE